MSSNIPIPPLPSSSPSSPQQMAAVRRLPKVTYGRHQVSSPSEADRSFATLVDADQSPFTKLNGEDFVVHEVHSSVSSQETRVGGDDDDDDEGLPRNDESIRTYDPQESGDEKSNELHANPRSTLRDNDSFVDSRRFRSKRATSTNDPETGESADDGTGSPGEFQFPWRTELKKIDANYARVDFASSTGSSAVPELLLAESPPSHAESSQQGRLSSLKTSLADVDGSFSDSGGYRSPSKSKTRSTKSIHIAEQSGEPDSTSDAVDKRKSRARSSRGKQKSAKPKTKRPTKKMLEETSREQARLLAEQSAYFPRVQESRPKYNLSELAYRFRADTFESSGALLERKSSFDPIQRWSSPTDKVISSPNENTLLRLPPKRRVLGSATPVPPEAGTNESSNVIAADSDDDAFPDLGVVVKRREAEQEKEEKRKKLVEYKQRILEQLKVDQARNTSTGEDDDDLEVLENVRDVRKTSRTKIAPGSRPWFPKKKTGDRSQEQLNMFLLKQSELQSADLIRRKEEDWVKMGGKIQSGAMDDGSHHKEAWLDKLSKKSAELDGNEGDVEGSDDEWTPEDPTVEPPASAFVNTGCDNELLSGIGEEESETSKYHDSDPDADENDAILTRRRVDRPSILNVIDSDDETKILVPATSPVQPLQLDRSSTSPSDDAIENGTDKENNVDLIFDMSEDKENILIRGRPAEGRLPLSSRSSSPLRRTASQLIPLFEVRHTAGDEERLPFKELCRDDDNSSDGQPSKPRFRKVSISSDGSSEATPLLAPIFGANNDSDGNCSPKPAVLQGAFSQLFGSGSIAQGRTLSFESPSESSTADKKRSGLDGLRHLNDAASLSLTLGGGGLQPALEVSDTYRRKADSIFEQEQAYLLGAANVAKSKKKPQLYINENGFLTPNRPDSTNPEIYRPPPTQASSPGPLTQTQRRPLGTISILGSSQISSPDRIDATGPMRRLKRYTSTSPVRKPGYQSSPSPSPIRRPVDAFDALRKEAVDDKAKKKEKGLLLEKSEFVQAEAQESDEDDGFGFAKKGDDTEDEGSDAENDKPLEGLVNDAAMDAEMEAKDKVVEKFKEHLEEDDVNLEKYHRDAVEGKFRSKRRNRGVDFEDSDSELDDDEAREHRRRMAKKRKVEGDTLPELAKNEETLPFVQAYENSLKEDDMLPILAEHDDIPMVDDDDDGNTESRESVSIHEIHEQVRQKAREKSVERFDPFDTAWLEDGEEEDDICVQTISYRKATRPRGEVSSVDPDKLRFEKRAEEPEIDDRLNTWAKANTRNSSSVYAPSGGSVTARPKAAPTKQKAGPGSTVAAKSEQRRSLRSGSSMLSAISNKRNKFDS